MALIYIADDDKDIRTIIKTFIENDGHKVEAFENGDKLYEAFLKQPCDLVLSDIMMPGTNGLLVLNRLRKISKVPIILVTAKDTDSDYIAGLSMGSDDYITKPFSPGVLSAKINALLRRIDLERENSKESSDTTEDIICGDIIYIAAERTVYKDKNPMRLTNTELKFMLYMMERQNIAVSKEELLNKIWGYESIVESRVADETSRRIRKKLSDINSQMYIQTVWGFGFKLTKKDDIKWKSFIYFMGLY